VRALKANNVDVTYFEIKSNYGHDAFLIEHEKQTRLIESFLHHVVNPI
jgi:homoserine O-acetyltransferase